MKKLINIILMMILLPVASYAEKIACANLDYSAKAEISEFYAGVVLLRRLHEVKINHEAVFGSFFGRIDNSESFEEGGYEFDMFAGGITVRSGASVYELACRAPSEYKPNTQEHLDHVENWNYIFN